MPTTSQATELATITERLTWTIRIGWGIAGLFIAVFAWLMMSYLPNTLQAG